MAEIFPQPWSITVNRIPRKRGGTRGLFKVSRYVEPDQLQYLLAGYSDEPAIFRRRRDAQEAADKLNRQERSHEA